MKYFTIQRLYSDEIIRREKQSEQRAEEQERLLSGRVLWITLF